MKRQFYPQVSENHFINSSGQANAGLKGLASTMVLLDNF